MRDEDKTKGQMMNELVELRQRIAELEALEAEHKRAEQEKLRGAQEQLLIMFESITDGVAFTDLELRITDINEAGLRLFGYSHKEEFIGRSGLEFISAKDHARAMQDMSKTLEKGHSGTLEYVFLAKDGTEFLAEYSVAVMRDKSGNPVGFVSTMKDITERKQAEEELRESEERYRAIIDLGAQVGEAIVMLQDTEKIIGRYVFVSDEWTHITGYSREELLGMSQADLIHPRYRAEAVERHHRRMRGETISGLFEISIIRKDGAEVPIELTGAYTTYQGMPAHVVYMRDITERKQAEEELIRNRDYLERLNNSLTDMVFEIKFPERTIRYINKAVETVLGYSREECMGQSIEMIYPSHEVFRELGRRLRKGVERGDEITTSEHELKRKNGRIIIVEGRTSYFKEDGKVVTALSVVRDITEQKRAEEALRESEEKFSRAFHSNPHPMSIVTLAEGRYLDVNDSYVQTFGFSREELLGRTTVEMGITKTGKFRSKILQSLKERQTVKNLEVELYTKSRCKVEALLSGDKMEISGQSCLLSVITDITERKRMEEEIRESEQRYIHAEKLGQFGHWHRDFIDDEVTWSTGTFEIFGVRPEQFKPTQENINNLIYPDDRQAVKIMRGDATLNGKKFDIEYRIIRPDGEERIVHSVADVYTDINGKSKGLFGTVIDITERKQAQEELIRNRDYLERLNDSLTDMVFEIKFPERTMRYINKAVETVLGYSREECIGQSIEMFYPSHEAFLEVGGRLRKGIERGDEITTSEHELKRKDGGIITVEGRTSYFREDGKVVSALSVVRDITERKQAEEALQLRAYLLNQAADSIVAADLKGNLFYVNETACRTYGYAKEEMLEMNLRDMVTAKQVRLAGGRIKKVIDEGYVSFESEHKRRDGSAFPVEITSRTIKLSEKTVILSAMRDITKRKRAEEALADEATRRRILIEQSRDGIVVLDQNGKVYESNQRFAEMLGYSPEEVRQLQVWDWEFQFTREQVQDMIRSVDAAGDHFETQHPRKDGTIYDVEISTNGAVFAGQKLVFCVCRDITERKRADEILPASE